MPTYSFRCTKCGREYDALVPKFGAVAPCPACGDKQPEKLMSLVAPLSGRGKTGGRSAPSCRPRRGSGFG